MSPGSISIHVTTRQTSGSGVITTSESFMGSPENHGVLIAKPAADAQTLLLLGYVSIRLARDPRPADFGGHRTTCSWA